MFCLSRLISGQRGVRPLRVEVRPKADSKYQQGFGPGWRIANAICDVMSCITVCMPERIE